MRRGSRSRRRNGAWLTGLTLAAVGCGGPTAEHLVVGDSVEPLAAAFEADSGKVRAIFLASPT